MTDKQIIIDGVNVVKCPHRKKEVTFMNVIKCYNYGACEGVNCLYKQLKRKEQECKELRTERKNLKWYLENNIQVKNHAMEEISQLKQTLAEIKDIVEWHTTSADSEDVQKDMKQILQKISEVENEQTSRYNNN